MVNGKMKNKRSAKSQSIIRMVLLLGILVLVNVIAQFAFKRIDMTQEKGIRFPTHQKTLQKDLMILFILEYILPEISLPDF